MPNDEGAQYISYSRSLLVILYALFSNCTKATHLGIQSLQTYLRWTLSHALIEQCTYLVLVVDICLCLQQPLNSLDVPHLGCNPQWNITHLHIGIKRCAYLLCYAFVSSNLSGGHVNLCSCFDQ